MDTTGERYWEEEEPSYWVALHDAIRGPRRSLADRHGREVPTEDCCTIEDMAAAKEQAPDRRVMEMAWHAPPKLRQAMVNRHPWLAENLAITAVVGVPASAVRRPVARARAPRCVPRRSRARAAARRGATRAGPDDDPDPDPRARAEAVHVGGAS